MSKQVKTADQQVGVSSSSLSFYYKKYLQKIKTKSQSFRISLLVLFKKEAATGGAIEYVVSLGLRPRMSKAGVVTATYRTI